VLVPLTLFAISLSIVNRDGHIEPALDQWRALPRFFKLAHESPLAEPPGLFRRGRHRHPHRRRHLAVPLNRGTGFQPVSSQIPSPPPPLALFAARVFLITGIIPGVLVGSAVAAAANMTDYTSTLADSAWIVVLGHTARFAFVPALVGVWLAAIEPPQERELRALDGALGFTGWTLACLPVQAGALIAAGLAAAALSLHEIESAVVLQPTGSPSLAQLLLNDLHQLRMQDLSAAGVVLVSGGLIIAGIAAAGMWWTARQTSPKREQDSIRHE